MEKGISSLLTVLKRRSLPALATLIAAIGGAVVYLSVTPRVYETSTRLMLDDKQVSVSELGRDLTQMGSQMPGGPSPLADQAELVKSQRVLEKAIEIFNSQFQGQKQDFGKDGLTAEYLRKNLSAKIVPATNILQLGYENKDPVLAAQLLNAVSAAMVDYDIKTISSEATKVKEFLENRQLPIATKKLQQAEVAENQYRQASGIVAFDEQTKALVENLASLEEQERTLSALLQESRSQAASLRQITDAGSLSSAYSAVRSGADEELVKMRASLAELERQLVEARLRFTPNHPQVMQLTEKRDAFRQMYLSELAKVSSTNQAVPAKNIASDQLSQELTAKLITNEVERLAIEKKLAIVQTQVSDLETRLAQLPIKQQPLTKLVREREEAASSLKFLQSKLEEARIAQAQKVSNVRIIESATVPESSASPKKPVVLALATIFGAILATGVILLLELMDNTLKDAREAEELLNLPLLGVLPRLPAKTLVLEPSDRFLDQVALVEPYRMLFKTLEFRNDDELHLIVVSSTISGEGKSVVVSHLAAVSAMLSRKTLIIDADLRRPTQHTLFNLLPKPGITEIIEGKRSFAEAIQKTDVENLDILTCGELHGRPSQLLESRAMKSILESAAKEYDLVIIDTPPISACADASTLSKQSDGVVLVTRPSFTNKQMLQRAVSELTSNQISILGVVVNGMSNLTEKYYHYPVKSYQPTRYLTPGRRR
ncbi:polysaccharide biosynthesis tyrosine autokinase [Rivularia sp. UHCC 0363]|uniref:GumC family protein n=1 Tax=Rivularia sp. UHCC 0363 TaxID=3110244 RepID=UPI002B1F217C|nr:polysaccharide biosynthesis tyrosine autokinase [Rivularia sp. UHCC 0363]MEA5593803.1 polysaccharide biosynthesis tyrosine autokinase [Rivularia sp. UHCC 0363]